MAEDSSDYELLPKAELDQLRREVAFLKKNSYGNDDKVRSLHESVDKLNATITKLVSILEDAQQDIIEEYQASKPAEKLNQLLDQGETIARAIVSMNEGGLKTQKEDGLDILGSKSAMPNFNEQQSMQPMPQPLMNMAPPPLMQPSMNKPLMPPPQFSSQQFSMPQFNPNSQMNTPQYPAQNDMQNQFNLPPMQRQQFAPQGAQMNQFGQIPPLNDLPPLDSLANIDSLPPVHPEAKKKKFLGVL